MRELLAHRRDQIIMLVALTKMGKHVYGGTVSKKEIAERRAKGRVAKQGRKRGRAD